MIDKPTISVIIPAFNEEGNLADVVKTVKNALADNAGKSEIIIFDDASSDNTGQVADRLARQDSGIRVIHNRINQGIAYNFFDGVRLAKSSYVTLIPGDNEISSKSIERLFQNAGKTDIVMLYPVNKKIRTFLRRKISAFFVFLINITFGLKMRYYNGPCLIKTGLLENFPFKKHRSFAYMAAILVQLIKDGADFCEVSMEIQPRKYGYSKALSLKNTCNVFVDLIDLFSTIYLKKQVFVKIDKVLAFKNFVAIILITLLTGIAAYYRIQAINGGDIRIRNGFESNVSMASYLFTSPAAYKDGSMVDPEYSIYDSFALRDYAKFAKEAGNFVFLRNPRINNYEKNNLSKSRSELGWAFILRYLLKDGMKGSQSMALRVVKFNLIIELIIVVLLFFVGKRIAGLLGGVLSSLLYALFMPPVHMMCYVTYYYWSIPFSVFNLFFWIVLYRHPPFPQYFKKKIVLFFFYGAVMGFAAATRMVLLLLPFFLFPFILLREKKIKVTAALIAATLAGQLLLLLPQMFVNKKQFGHFAISTRETWHQFFMGIGSRQNPFGIENSGDFAAFDYIEKTTGVNYSRDGIDKYNKASRLQALKIIKENPKLLIHNAIENIKSARLINPTAFYAIDTPFNKFTSFADIQQVNFDSLNSVPLLKKYLFWLVLSALILILINSRQRFVMFLIVFAQTIYLILVVCLYFPNYLYFMSGYIPAWVLMLALSVALIVREPILFLKTRVFSRIRGKDAF